MSLCKQIQELIPLVITKDGISLREEMVVSQHLKKCAKCAQEYKELNDIIHTTKDLNQEIDQVIGTIDWDNNRQDLLTKIDQKRYQQPELTLNDNRWFTPKLSLIAASVLLVGIFIGYILFSPSSNVDKSFLSKASTGETYNIAVIEDNFKKRTILDYFKQVKFYFLEITEAQNLDNLDPQQSQELISQTSYLLNSIEGDYSLINAGELLRDIEFILIELDHNRGMANQGILKFIKDLIQNKRLLLKIHLVSNDIKNIKTGV